MATRAKRLAAHQTPGDQPQRAWQVVGLKCRGGIARTAGREPAGRWQGRRNPALVERDQRKERRREQPRDGRCGRHGHSGATVTMGVRRTMDMRRIVGVVLHQTVRHIRSGKSRIRCSATRSSSSTSCKPASGHGNRALITRSTWVRRAPRRVRKASRNSRRSRARSGELPAALATASPKRGSGPALGAAITWKCGAALRRP